MMNPKDSSLRTGEALEAEIINQKTVPYLQHLGYRYIDIGLEVAIGNRSVTSDVVVYLDQEKTTPHIVVEVKRRLLPGITILDPAVQQAFAVAVAAGSTVRYLLVTDGLTNIWFERSLEERSLVRIDAAPEFRSELYQGWLFDLPLSPVIDSNQYERILFSLLEAFPKRTMIPPTRLAIDLNRLLIAKLYDEHNIRHGKAARFKWQGEPPDLIAEQIKRLYREATIVRGDNVLEDWSWSLPPSSFVSAVKILEPYAITTASPSVLGRTYWSVFLGAPFVGGQESGLASPVSIAALLVGLLDPAVGERIIDLGCGTGLFLVEMRWYMAEKLAMTRSDPFDSDPLNVMLPQDMIGVESLPDVALLATTNLMLNSLSPRHIVRADALNEHDLRRADVTPQVFDAVVMDPPTGKYRVKETDIRWSEAVATGAQPTLELLFVEMGLRLLRDGGKLAAVVPDTFLSAPSHLKARTWLLENATPRAIISLPAETFSQVGHSGKATVLLLEKRPARSSGKHNVLVADLQAIGYDRSYRPTNTNALPELHFFIRSFLENGIAPESTNPGLRTWQTIVKNLDSHRLDVGWLDPEGYRLANDLRQGRYPVAKLRTIASIHSGRNFKEYVDHEIDTAVLIQAGAVRDLSLDVNASIAPRISTRDFDRARSSQIEMGDILVTTTGQYLGRATLIDDLQYPAVASGAVTIVRPKTEDVDRYYLAAVISSSIGKEQIMGLQASGTAQPYIRRADLGEILIPLPPIDTQRRIAQEVRVRLEKARSLVLHAEQLENEAAALVIGELLGVDKDG